VGTINRNALCPCGSGKKYKKCCMGSSATVAPAALTPDVQDWGKPSQGRDQDNELDRFIIQGYDQLDKQDHKAACVAWSRVWDLFLLQLSPKMISCNQTLPVYDGSFHLSNWLQDYCAALHNAALEDSAIAQTGASFCSQVLLQFPQEEDLLGENFSRT
jgi:hypothetical protein